MIDSGDYLWNCLRYIDLNMVRAGIVRHPSEWPWCSYRELVGQRKRFRLLDTDRLASLLNLPDRQSLIAIHQQRISDAIQSERLAREGIWTESIAVGSEDFVKEIIAKNKERKRLYISATDDGTWHVKEYLKEYAISCDREKGTKICT
jgi:putative transposase